MNHTEWRDGQTSVRVSTPHHEFDVAYRDDPDSDATPTLFLHGIPSWSFLFRTVADAVDRPILPDLAGYGYTDHVGPGGYDRSIRAQEDVITSFLDALDLGSVQVVGHDIGGSLALRLAVHTDRVERLVLSNAACYDSWPVEFIHSLGLPGNAATWTDADLDDALDFVFPDGTYERASREFTEGMKAPFLEREGGPERLARDAISTNTNHTLELTPHLGGIDAPTLLLWGGEDVLQGTEWADRLAEDLPNAEKRYLDRAYHWVMEDRPEAYAAALGEFLD